MSYRHFSLGMFYQEHKLWRNEWSTSNQGYDLARYFGTKLRFYPHETVDYIVYWETNFEIPERNEMPMLAPGTLLNIKKKMIVHSLKRRGRSKRLFLKPPPVHTNQWYFQKTWCNIPLFKLGIVPVNFKAPFLHNRHFYGVWIGYMSNWEPPTTVSWSLKDIATAFNTPRNACKSNGGPWSTSTSKEERDKIPESEQYGKMIDSKEQWQRRVYYRWWWDDGVDNYVMVNKYNYDPIEEGGNSCYILKVDMPYWRFFWGLSTLTSKASPLCKPGTNPSIYALTWYADLECRKWTEPSPTPVWPLPAGSTLQYPDQDLCGPETIPVYKKRKFWVMLSQCYPWGIADSHQMKAWNLPDYDTVRTILTGITNSGPFAVSFRDVYPDWQNLNIGMTYTSFWQWGGFRPKPDTTEDPCNVGGDVPPRPRQQPRAVQVDDPADSSKLTIHPWDLQQNGIYTTETIKRLLSNVYPELLADRRERGVPQEKPPEEQRPKWREDGDKHEPVANTSSSEESSTDWSELEDSEGQATETPGYPTLAPGVERKRKRLQRHDHGEFRRVRRRLNRFLNERNAKRAKRS